MSSRSNINLFIHAAINTAFNTLDEVVHLHTLLLYSNDGQRAIYLSFNV